MGIVHHANYLVWMEVGRVELVRSLGVSYGDMEETHGLYLSVIHASCRYVFPARYDQMVCVETNVEALTPRGIEFGYEIRLEDSGKKLAEGTTRHIWLNRELRPTRLPEQFLALLSGELIS